MWGRGISQYSKDEKICKKHDKGKLSKVILNAENRFASGGFAPLIPYKGSALDPEGPTWPLDPSPKLVPPKGAMSGSGPESRVTKLIYS